MKFEHVGIIGAGIGGLACAIALRRHSKGTLKVIVLEAASELGEIGAGIQMTPNVSRLLIRWGIADVIGNNLVCFDRLNLRTKDGKVVGTTGAPKSGGPERWAGAPWWLVHRMHLHDGLVTAARREGVEVIIAARVCDIENQESCRVQVRDEQKREWEFDLVIGADGLHSVTRKTILPDITPKPPTNNAAYRAILPMALLKSDPLTRDLVEESTMDVWMGAAEGKQHGYIIVYPISAGSVFNMVMSHHRPDPVMEVEDIDMNEMRETYRDYDPRIRRVLDMIPDYADVRRWPLLMTRCPTWSSPEKNIVLIGDAAHSMVNHLAQGAATAMEDGAFLGIMLREVAKGTISLEQAISKYEEERMPLADLKQQKSFLAGLIYHLEDGSPEQLARDKYMEGELRGEQLIRSPNMNADPYLWRSIFDYDSEAHAERAIAQILAENELRNPVTSVTREMADLYMNWWLPEGKIKVKSLL